MATIKVFTVQGVKELNCFDNLEEIPFLDPETGFEEDPFDDLAEMEAERRKERTRQNFEDQFGPF